MNQSPFLDARMVGRCDTLLGFLVWAQNFRSPIGAVGQTFLRHTLLRLIDGYDDISLRAQRVKNLIKYAKLTWDVRKRGPLRTIYYGGFHVG